MTNPPPDDVRYEYDATREHLSLNVGGGHLRLSAVELERLVQFLAYLRAAMAPEVEHELPQGACPSIDAPRLAVQLTPDGLRTAIGVRTPAFGWIALLLDRAQTEGVGAHLTALAPTMSVRAD
ncbi:MAG: hypothetical protein ABI585_12140 [Betaproteobacteria bacterium]